VRILADASLPVLIEEPNSSGADIVRFVGEAVSDQELVRYAAMQGFAAILLLGRNAEADVRLLEAAHAAGVTLITTVSENPTEAAHQVLARLADAVALVPRQATIVIGKNGPLGVTAA